MDFRKKQKRIKLFLWFFFALMTDLIIMHNFKILYAKPVISYILMILAMLLEKEFSYAMKAALLMAVVFASLLGGSFGFEVIFIMAVAVIVFSAGRRNKYIPEAAMTVIAVAAFTAVHIAYMIIYADGVKALEAMGNMIAANIVYNIIAALVIYIPFKRNVYKEDVERKLIS